MPVLTTDDQVRRLRAVWYGTSDFRWPFDARYLAWVTAAALTPVGFVALWLVVPVGVLVLVVAWLVGGGKRRDATGYVMTGTVTALVLLAVPLDVLAGTFPLLLAAPCALAVAVWGTRRVMRLVDSETPLRYWRVMLASEVRELRWLAPRTVAPTFVARKWWQWWKPRLMTEAQVAVLESEVFTDLDEYVAAESSLEREAA